MSDSLEHQLDLALDTREQRCRQHKAEESLTEKTIEDRHAELKHQQFRFCTEVRFLMREFGGTRQPPFGKKAGEVSVV